MTLTNNEWKAFMLLKNRGTLLKGTTRKITRQVGEFLNFPKPLLSTGWPLMKNVLTPLAESLLVPCGPTVAASAADAATQKKIFGSGTTH